MKKLHILNIEAIVGILNLLVFLYFVFFVPSSYLIAEIPKPLFDTVLLHIPLGLSLISLTIFIFDLIRSKEKNWYCFFVITLAILPPAILAIGTLFINNH